MASTRAPKADAFFSGIKTGPQQQTAGARRGGKPSNPKHNLKGRDKGKGKAKESKPSPETQQELILANQALSAPPALAPFSALRKLDLSKTGLASLGFVKDVRNTLTWLNVSGNDLSAEGAWDGVHELGGLFVLNASECNLTQVPSVVEVLHSLKALVMTHNKLQSLDHIKRLVQLNTIVVSNNELKSLPTSLATLPALKKLSCSHNKLSSGSLPDLSALALLREVRLSHNPTLTSLPDHFASWGKADDGSSLKRSVGLEIVDLSSCAFASWYGLKALAGQDGIHNLSLIGNKVADEARAEGFDEFKAKMNILLPSLRILDGHRFDPKFADLKKRRDARTEEERIVEAGPMMLAINKRKEEPVLIPKQMLKEKDVLRRNKKRLEGVLRKEEMEYKKALREAVKTGHDPETVPKPKVLLKAEKDAFKAGKKAAEAGVEEEAEGEASEEKMDVDEGAEPAAEVEASAETAAEDEQAPAPEAEVEVKPKKERKRKAAVDGEVAEGEDGTRKKKKNRHAARREAETGDATRVRTVSTSTPTAEEAEAPVKQRKRKDKAQAGEASAAVEVTAAPVEEAAGPKHRKRGRDKKNPDLLPAPRKEREPSPPRPKKKKGGVLADLKGDGSYTPAQKAPEAQVAPVEQPPAPVKESKAKTSVLKVVEVKKKGEERVPVDIMALFGEKKSDAIGAGWD